VLNALTDEGLTGFVTLHHFTLPRWFAAQGGWLGSEAVASFSRYCEFVAGELGDLMPFVCTINEPQMIALHGYLEGYHPPGISNPILWKRVGRVLLRAHQSAVRALRRGSGSPMTGLAVQIPLLAPIRDDEACQAHYRTMQHEIVDLYLDALTGPDRGDWLGVHTASNGSIRHRSPCSPTRRPARD
jgi:beta-glucosidase